MQFKMMREEVLIFCAVGQDNSSRNYIAHISSLICSRLEIGFAGNQKWDNCRPKINLLVILNH